MAGESGPPTTLLKFLTFHQADHQPGHRGEAEGVVGLGEVDDLTPGLQQLSVIILLQFSTQCLLFRAIACCSVNRLVFSAIG
jgi:hypothetical protein